MTTLKTRFRLKLLGALVASSCLAGTAHAQDIVAIDSRNTLVVVNSSRPTEVRRTVAVTGLGAGQTLLAIDGRPLGNGRVLYGISNTGQLYTINPMTGVASAVGAPIALASTSFDIDFNPTVDRIRLVGSTGQNLRINPDTGAIAATDLPLNILVGGQRITVTGNTAAAYTNNFAGTTTTTLYVINTETGAVQIQNPPNDGTQTRIGGIGGAAAGTVVGFDIARTGEARLTVTQAGVTSLFSVDLTTGVATLLGTFGTAGTYRGLAYLPVAFADSTILTPNQRAVASTFDNFTSVAPGFVTLLNTLDALPDDAARASAFRVLGPVDYGILPDVVLQTNEFVDGTLRRYLREDRPGDTRRLGGFIIGTGRTGSFDARGDRARTDVNAVGVIAGVDYQLTPDILIGLTGGYDAPDVRLNAISPTSKLRTTFGGAYANARFGKIDVDIVGSYGEVDATLQRNVAFGTFASSATATTRARYYAVSGTVRTAFDLGQLRAEPYVGVRFADVRVNGISEGAALTNLTVATQRTESLQSVAGLRLRGSYPVGSAQVRPAARAEYRHEFNNGDPRLLTAAFSGAGISTPFTSTTTPLGRDYVVAGAELAVVGSGPVELLIDYTGQFSGGYNIHAVRGGMRLRF